ncbi:MAG: hypothetical protein JWO35_222 [Candidatus Saccharibacteria bacterium]|nr:hypothetical protein [Candidatus Saccharibacteria bacterium]
MRLSASIKLLHTDTRGVTIVELLVVMIVSSLIMGVVTSFGLDYWASSATLEADQETLVSRLNSGDYLRNAFNSTSGLITQNDIADLHTGSPDSAKTNGQYWLPIHAVPSTIQIGAKGTITPIIYFNRPSIDTSKNFIMNGTQPYEDDVILYMNGTTKQLLARTIANSSAANNRAKTSCPAALATTNCPADIVIAEDVSGAVTRYFSRSGNTIDYTSIVDPSTGAFIGPDFPSVEVIELKVNLFRKGKLSRSADSSNQTVVRVALRN